MTFEVTVTRTDAVRVKRELSPAERAARVLGGRARAAQMTTDDRSTWGRRGYQATLAKFGGDKARMLEAKLVSERQRFTSGEKAVAEFLAEEGLQGQWEHVVAPFASRWFSFDFWNPNCGAAIEVRGGVHFLDTEKSAAHRRNFDEKMRLADEMGYRVHIIEWPAKGEPDGWREALAEFIESL